MALSSLTRSFIVQGLASISAGNEVGDAIDAATSLLGATPGTVTAGKALVPDSNKDLASLRDLTTRDQTLRNLTLTGGTITLNTTTATNIVALTDNLADAFSIKEGSNFYVTIVTTDSGELIRLRKTTELVNANIPAGGSTAAAGTTTTDAGVLPAGTSSVYPTTGATDAAGVRINAADKVTGRTLFIGNGVSNKILKVYAPSGGTINGAAGDAAFSSASGKGVIITCLDATGNTWLAW